MAFYIDLDKIEHTEEYVRYKYYNSPDADVFKEIQSAPNDPNGYMFERAAMKLIKHWKKGEFPDRTYWAS